MPMVAFSEIKSGRLIWKKVNNINNLSDQLEGLFLSRGDFQKLFKGFSGKQFREGNFLPSVW